MIYLVICAVAGSILLFYLLWENKKWDGKSVHADRVVEQGKRVSVTKQTALMNTTDMKNREFR